MQYAIIVYENEQDLARRFGPDTAASYLAPYEAYVRALREAGVLVGGEALRSPTTATTVRFEGGQRIIEDGPLPQTREQLGGFFVIEVPDLDAAITWASRCPAARSAGVELRPVVIAGA